MPPLNLFISHVSTYKQIATNFAKDLAKYNLTPFVAHEEIEPTAVWQEEIEKFLHKADCLLVLLSKGCSDSIWCNQEIGIALGRSIPIVSVRIDEDPKGFIGKWQAYTPKQPINYSHEVGQIIQLIRKMASRSNIVREWLIDSLNHSRSFYESNDICDALLGIQLSKAEIQSIKKSFMKNSQVKGANNITNILNEKWIASNT